MDKGLLSAEQLTLATQNADQRRESLEKILVDMRVAPKDEIMWARAEELGKIYVDLSNRKIDIEIASLIPESTARRHRLVCIGRMDKKITLAMSDPTDIFALDDVRIRTGCIPEPVLSFVDDIERANDAVYSTGDSKWQSIVGDAEDVVSVVKDQDDLPEEVVVDAPIVRLADLIITQAIQQKASDIHVEPFEREVVVRYRIDGILRPVMNPPKAIQPALISRLKIMANLNIAEKRVPQDGRIQVNIKRDRYDLRVSVLPCLYGESIVMRILDRKSVMVDLDRLGFHPDLLERWKKLIVLPNGVILVTGPTGSGKSTTLYATLNDINDTETKIVTIEDPVEYNIPGINQVQVHPKVGLTFAAGLRSFLRQDPDVMMVGEIRDQETALIAVQSALTGHLVLSTLHTNDSVSAITRLIDMGIEPFLLASSIQGVMAQRLVRTVCPLCKRSVKLLKAVTDKFLEHGIAPESIRLVKGEGCDNCAGTGYKGRAGVHELFVMTDEMRRLILERGSASDLRKMASSQGLRTLYNDGLSKVAKGITTLEEVLRVAVD
ncbi:MAG: type II secretion system ATPase GspE [Candidatus Eremiobacteraeota bacterium]|nr:type II secretion system ATPase GspE [Candidatus Eremiobacteraeota bacterium]MBC5826879.1 type II secretion system ATPase GspE [Candidatus Eremiobacteraeota bacterium]